MATVTGMTAEKIDEITNGQVTGGNIDPITGVLTLQKRDGSTISVGNVDTAKSITASVDKAYPVGSIFMSVIATNPASQLGVGTWTSWGVGRVPVGVDASQTEFNTVEKTGGAKTHTLTLTQMPRHSHSVPAHQHVLDAHTHTIDHDHADAVTAAAGEHTHTLHYSDSTGIQMARLPKGSGTESGTNVQAIDTAGSHSHAVDIPVFSGTSGAGGGGWTDPSSVGTSGNTGGNGVGATDPMNNLPPYITCYMWKRTA